jgi:ATP-binding cassette subfamily B protein
MILLSITLLFVQANAELALPDYLSRIVNNGIQQNGVENAVPVAIRQSEMEKLLIFMNPEEGELVLDSYNLLESGSTEAEGYLEDYPVLDVEAIYVLKDLDQSLTDQLNSILGKALVTVAGIRQMMEDPSQAPPMETGFDFDLSLIPEGMDVFQVLGMMPEAQRAQIRKPWAWTL